MPTRVAGIEMRWPAALINVYEQSSVRIFGLGIIDGDGKQWWDKYWQLRQEYDSKGLRWAADYDAQRPRLIQIYKSDNVDLQGLTLRRSGFWTVHICYSSKVTVDGITIRNNIGGRGPSTDGIGVDSSSDVLVQNADIECNDDAVVMKAGRDADGLRVHRPTENVRDSRHYRARRGRRDHLWKRDLGRDSSRGSVPDSRAFPDADRDSVQVGLHARGNRGRYFDPRYRHARRPHGLQRHV